MASKFRIRIIFRPLVNLLAKGLIRIKISPNFATIIMLCFSALSYICLVIFQNLLCFSIFVFVTGIMDGCDGAIARLTNKSTKFGGFFDSFMDRFSEFFIFFGLFIYTTDQFLWNCISMNFIILVSFLASVMISYSRTRAEVFFKGDFDIGLMARSERLFYIVIISIIGFFSNLINLLLFVFMVLVIGTFLFRIINIYYVLKRMKNQN